jgi:branched-chain amino acid transport system ATP-binding protein
MLEIAGLDVTIQSVGILRGVTMAVPTGSMTGLIGRNGAGKTTLMRSVMGLAQTTGGAIRFEGTDLLALPTHARTRLGIGYMPEDRRLIPQLTVEENILLPAWAAGVKDTGSATDRVYAIIPELVPMRARKALSLSGGQQKLVALARALVCGSRLLLLDEPFEGVAPALARRLVELIGSLRGGGLSVVLSESDLQHSAQVLDRVFRIDRGEVTAEALPERA